MDVTSYTASLERLTPCTRQRRVHANARSGWAESFESKNLKSVTSSGRYKSRVTRLKALHTELQVAEAFVSAPLIQQPKGIIHFLGGAFAGAAPQLAYQCLIRWLAEAGYTVVATPYQVTFRHLASAASVHQSFQRSVAELSRGDSSWMVPRSCPIHGVGHSNGALLHLLIGSQLRPPNASNVIISYNNKQVKQAIPVPLTGLQSLLRGARASGIPGALPTTEALLERAVALSAATQGVLDRATATALRPALDQVGAVLTEVEEGFTDFLPSPRESRELISRFYGVPETLLLRFSDDAIDETELISPLLSRVGTQGPIVQTLPGSHVTPCGADLNWKVGRQFTPIDALALASKAVIQTDLRRTTRAVVQWLDGFGQPGRSL